MVWWTNQLCGKGSTDGRLASLDHYVWVQLSRNGKGGVPLPYGSRKQSAMLIGTEYKNVPTFGNMLSVRSEPPVSCLFKFARKTQRLSL
ncbi:hypothetical protein DSM43276_01032 [Mycobacteroides salmoniphilum]|nr:hypothetical protein DSM43276_01032 [Mycobacteroides salmoniphilum]